jgi:hypothetical protein
MLKKIIAPLVVAGVLAGGVATAGAAYASTPTTATTASATGHAQGQKAHAWLRSHRRQLRRAGLAISAKTIGVTPKALAAELHAGKSIADVAGEHNVSTQTVTMALTNAADAKINQAVTNHKLTPAQASKIEARVPALVAKAVAHTF